MAANAPAGNIKWVLKTPLSKIAGGPGMGGIYLISEDKRFYIFVTKNSGVYRYNAVDYATPSKDKPRSNIPLSSRHERECSTNINLVKRAVEKWADEHPVEHVGLEGHAAGSIYGRLLRMKGPRGVSFHFQLTEAATKQLGYHRDQDGKRPTVKERQAREAMRQAVAGRLHEVIQGHRVDAIDIFAKVASWAPWQVDHVSRAGLAAGDRPATELLSITCASCHEHSARFEVPFGADWKRRVPPEVIGWMNKHNRMHARPAGHAAGFQYDPNFIKEPWVKLAVARAKWKTARKRVAARREEDRRASIEPVPMKRPVKGYR